MSCIFAFCSADAVLYGMIDAGHDPDAGLPRPVVHPAQLGLHELDGPALIHVVHACENDDDARVGREHVTIEPGGNLIGALAVHAAIEDLPVLVGCMSQYAY